MEMNIAICGGGSVYRKQIKKSIQMLIKMKGLPCRNIDSYAKPKLFLQAEKSYDILFLSAVSPKDGMQLNDILRQRNQWLWIIYVLNEEETKEIVGIVHAIDHLENSYSQLNLLNALNKGLGYLHYEEKGKKLIFRNGVDSLYLRPEQIYCIEYIGNHKIKIVIKGTNYEIRYLLKETYAQTRRYGFSRTHKGIIVNLLHVVRRIGFMVHLVNGDKVALAQSKVEEFEDDMERFARGEWEEE